MKQMAQEETDKIRLQMQSLETQMEVLLLPKDPLDERSIMLEVCAGHSAPHAHAAYCAQPCSVATLHERPGKERKEKSTPLGDHNGSL